MGTSYQSAGVPRRMARWRAAAAAVALVIASVAAALVVAPAPASANCFFPLNPRSFQTIVNGLVAVQEDPREICDNNNQYLGRVTDTLTDGFCGYAVFYDPVRFVQGISCITGVGANYFFNDPQGDSFVNPGSGPWINPFLPPGSVVFNAGF